MKTGIFCGALILALLLGGCGKAEASDPDASSSQPSQAAQESTAAPSPQLSGWADEEGGRCYYLPDGSRVTGWMGIGEERYYFEENGYLHTGWLEIGGECYYLDENGAMRTGWLEIDGERYYLGDDGVMRTGWAEIDQITYYFCSDGAMARGQVEIDGVNHFFTSAGAEIIVVNPWNSVPEDYDPDLVSLSTDIAVEGSQISSRCYDALVQMVSDCNQECPTVYIVSAYRSHERQTNNYNRKVNYYLDLGYSEADARIAAAKVVAYPGTSEHELGLAVDIIDTREWSLTETQADLPAQQWLMENSWRYGFILRYPSDKTDVTGIIYEPWHYRYVGIEVATELHESGLTLEEYIQALTD